MGSSHDEDGGGGGFAEENRPPHRPDENELNERLKMYQKRRPQHHWLRRPEPEPFLHEAELIHASRLSREDDSSGGSGGDSAESGDRFDIAVLEREECHYGWGSWRPSYLQWCLRPVFVLIAMCLCTVTQAFGMSGVFPSGVRFIQLRFYLTSWDMGLTRMMHDVGHFLTLWPVLYFGVRANRPMWIGVGSIAIAVASALMTLPQFVTPPYNYKWFSRDTCAIEPPSHDSEMLSPNATDAPSQTEAVERSCDDVSIKLYKYWFLICALLYGMGTGPVYAFAMTYMDENVSPRISSLFNGLLSISSLIGAAAGLLLSAYFNSIYGDKVNLKPGEKMDLESGDPRWYGAWWIGMLVASLFNVIAAVVVLGLPSQLPGAMRARIDYMRLKKEQPSVDSGQLDDEAIGSVFKKCWAVLRRSYYDGLVINRCLVAFLTVGFGTFMPLYFHMVFGVTDSMAAIYAGFFGVVAIVSALIGTFIQYILRLDLIGNVRLSLVAACGTVLFAGVFLVRCPQTSLAGVTAPYPNDTVASAKWSLDVPCNAGCNCSDEIFNPVCYDANNGSLVIYNKCYAGCTHEQDVADDGHNCMCVPADESPVAKAMETGGYVRIGYCKSTCWQYRFRVYAFTLGFTWIVVSIYTRKNAIEQGILRCVPFQLRLLSLGIADAVTMLLGQIPSSPVIGWLITKTCLRWKSRCRIPGICVMTNVTKLSNYTTAICFVNSFIALVAIIVAERGVRRRGPGHHGTSSSGTGESHHKEKKKPHHKEKKARHKEEKSHHKEKATHEEEKKSDHKEEKKSSHKEEEKPPHKEEDKLPHKEYEKLPNKEKDSNTESHS